MIHRMMILLLLTSTGFAHADKSWLCHAKDNQGYGWKYQGKYRLSAYNKSLDLCKKNSKVPATCHASKDSCYLYVHGYNISPMWQCMALDANAKSWRNRIAQSRNGAAIASLSTCKRKSKIPGTCYINLLTCSNLNKQ